MSYYDKIYASIQNHSELIRTFSKAHNTAINGIINCYERGIISFNEQMRLLNEVRFICRPDAISGYKY